MTTKHSHKRDAIANAICSRKDHPSADHIYAEMRELYPSISLGTIYRNIAQLRSDGVIKSVGVVNGVERYDGDMSEHPHFVCEHCGAVIDIAPEDAAGEKPDAFIAEKYGIRITSRHIVYNGSCGKCLTNLANHN